MKKIKSFIYIAQLVVLLFVSQKSYSQSDNKLFIPVVESGAGKTASVSVYLSNESGIVAVQFKLHVPTGFTVTDNSLVKLTDRKDNHTLTVKNLGNNDYLFVIFSLTNAALRGNSGILLQIPVSVPDTCTTLSVRPFSFSQVILSKISGENALSASDAGAVKIIAEPRPDVTVTDVISSNTTVNPGNKVSISWNIKNIGDLSTSSGWSEQVSLMGDNGESVYLGTINSDQLVSAGGVVSRQADFIVPKYAGVEGNVKVLLKVVPNSTAGELPAAQYNNTAKSNDYISVGRSLFLIINKNVVAENDPALIPCQLFRSGSRATEQTFTITSKNEGRLKIPSSVTIPVNSSGSAFYVNPIDNQVLNADSFAIVSASGNNYSSVSDTLQIVDNELPSLIITPSKTDLSEGDLFSLTIERGLVTSTPLKVNLSTDYNKRFSVTPDIVIPANEKSIKVSITAIDDAIPALTVSPVFTATASGYNNGTATVSLADNDVPVISLAIAPGSVSESAGYQSAIGVVSRQGATDNVITIKLIDNSNGELYYSTPTITLEKGVSQKQFTVGVVDNALVDGNKDFDITASVYISSCGCSASGTGAGTVHTKLTVLDDDGPALKVTSSQTMLAEGKTQATLLTITRNTATTQALTVSLSTDHPDDLTFEKTIIIPIGSVSVTVPVAANSNATTEGDRTVTFTAESSGYTKGVCWAMITDQTLADATVTINSVSANSALAKDAITAKIRVNNTGVAALASGIPVNIYLSNASVLSSASTKQLLTTISTSNQIAANGYEILTTPLTLPDLTGQYYLTAVVNESQTFKELSYLNNTSTAQSIQLMPAYSATVSADKKTYNQGQTIILSGKAVAQGGSTISGVSVDVYVINNGYRQVLSATTDASGTFQVIFTPISGQMGHFSVGACYPGQGLSDEQTSFDIYGLKRTTTDNIIWEVLSNEQKTGEIEISNPGSLALTGLKTAIVSNPATGVTLTFDALNDLAAGGTAKLKYTLTGTTVSTGTQYDQIKFKVSSNEGATLDLTGYYYCRSQKAVLKANVPSIQTTMAKGVVRTYKFTLTNNGKGTSGKISIMIPTTTWLSLVTPAEIPSLAYGESATVILQLSPSEDMKANVPVSGSIGINCENGSGIPLAYRIETVSEKTGILEVDVCDEYTYNTQAAPHLSGASVKIKQPYTGTIVSEGVTGVDGLYTLPNLPEGYYTIVVTAPKHGNYQNQIYVEPGKTTTEVAFIQFQAITYSWDVIQTTIEDKYEVSLTTKFETNVPKPVVLIDIPNKLPALSANEEFAFVVNLTNSGLITAKNVVLNFPSHPLYEFSTTYQPSDIPANSTIQVFVIMRHKNIIQKNRAAGPTLGDYVGAAFDVKDVFCNTYSLVADYFYLCGGYELRQAAVTAMDIDAINFICSDFEITIPWPENPNTPVPNNPLIENHELQGPWDNGNYNPDCLLYTLCSGLKPSSSNTKGLLKAKSSVQDQSSVCAKVLLKFNQTVTLTREAFEGTLKISNGAETAEMKNIKLDLEIKDETGIVRNDLFQINTISLDQITGIDGNGIIEALKTGTAIIQFIPEKGAAPIISKSYSFGGSFSYLDPFTNVIVTTKLLPVTLTVKPCPDLYLTYFLQRDIFGDDPLTSTIEPIEPAELSLLLNNKGAGEATNVVLDSEQPKIIENEKGLDIDFKMIGSSLNGAATSMGLTKVDFGNISAGKTSFGQWWFTSSLLGHFSKYDAKLTHLTSYDNPDLSLISDVSVHELIRSLNIPITNGSPLIGFLANDIPDAEDLPDMIYISDGSKSEVNVTTNAVFTKTENNKYTMVVTPGWKGWNYGVFNDPENGKLILTSVVRHSDNAAINLRNFWQTDRTLRDGKDPLYEYKIHFADDIQNATETYLLTFEPKRENILSVKSFSGVPDGVSKTAITTVNVVFNKGIDQSTFTSDDITLSCHGSSIDAGKVSISKVSDSEYSLDLSQIPEISGNGYFVVTIQTKNITDNEGYQGETGKQASWNQYVDGNVQLTLKVVPTNSGKVTPGSGGFNYAQLLAIQAIPEYGYQFKNWTLDGSNLSTESSISYVPVENKTLIANFDPKKYNVSVSYDANEGLVTGSSTGLYDYKSMLSLTAIPNTDYDFVGWQVNNVDAGNTETLNTVVTNDLTITPKFKYTKIATSIPPVVGQKNLFMTVYPNPSNKGLGVNVEVSIPNNEIKDCELEITSLLGSVVKLVPLTSNKIHVSDIASGMYVFKLKSAKLASIFQKVIIQ